ncbi:MAG: hypothetical protein ACQESE_00505 [Nanobdellota archaeon]
MMEQENTHLSMEDQIHILEYCLLGSIEHYEDKHFNEVETIRKSIAEQYTQYRQACDYDLELAFSEKRKQNKETIDDFFLTHETDFREYFHQPIRPMNKLKRIINPFKKTYRDTA